ncbi:GntR family transcriptional regulator [Ruania alba]|uniref:DNA-binding transcriptional regulator, GntR family n=1 Tax=Ruania alba TaxID=648782 RepID=A0A1H5LBT1_9MICO|nr:GntR family transcriptional regulator [Ruania alba]SEE74513.1 DNA-binding transcriptional regulator, GntR family [Ruania alba]
MIRNADAASGDLEELAARHQTAYRSVGAMVYGLLQEAILNGTLRPGQKLRQETLAEQIGVSRLPVRSALIQLESDGLVEFHDRRGATVRAISPEQAKEVYRIRALLEVDALKQSMKRSTPERIEQLRELAKSADEQNEGADFVEARTKFYSELYDAAQNPITWEMIEQLRLKMGRYVLGWRLVGGSHTHSHEDLVDAFASGDATKASAMLRKHLAEVLKGVLSWLDAEATGTD